MKLGVYVMRDARTTYMQPTFDMNDASAIRNFEHALSQKDSLLFSHPEDYSLYRIGSYDAETGVIDSEVGKLLCDGKSFA